MHQQRTEPLCLFGQNSRRNRVDLHRSIALGFRVVDSGIRGRINDDIRPCFPDGTSYGGRIAEIELVSISCDDIAKGCQGALQFPADLSFSAGKEDLQRKTSAWRSGVPRWSLSFSTGLATGHLIPTSGSFQSNTRSSFGE